MRIFLTTFACAALVSAAPVWAQKNAASQSAEKQAGDGVSGEKQAPRQSKPGRELEIVLFEFDVMPRNADGQIAAILALDNKKEIALGHFALERTKNEAVQTYARRLIDDHTRAIEQLCKVESTGMKARTEARTAAGQASGAQAAGASQAAPGQRAAQAKPQKAAFDPQKSLPFVAMQTQIARQVLKMAAEDMRDKQGYRFDAAFIGQEIAAHENTVATLRVLQNYASDELRQVLTQEEQMAKEHLEHLRKLMGELEQQQHRSS